MSCTKELFRGIQVKAVQRFCKWTSTVYSLWQHEKRAVTSEAEIVMKALKKVLVGTPPQLKHKDTESGNVTKQLLYNHCKYNVN